MEVDPESKELLLRMIHDQRMIVDYFYVATVAVLLYDHLLTLHLEIALVWNQSRWTYTKVVFLMARYLPILGIFLLLYNQAFLNVSPDACRWGYYAASWVSMLGVMFAECIFILRTWAVWNRNNGVGMLLIFMISVIFISEVVCAGKFANAIEASNPPFQPYRGCIITGNSIVIYTAALYSLAALDAVILGLMVLSAFRAYRLGETGKLSSIIHKDAIVFYVYILCITLVGGSVVRSAPVSLINIYYPLPVVLYSVLSTRVVLNIRAAAMVGMVTESDELTELHTVYNGEREGYLVFHLDDVSRNTLSDSDAG